MLQESVYDLTSAKPHVNDDDRFTDETWAAYAEGYYTALYVALMTMSAAERRFALYKRTKAIESRAKRKREQ